jgi:hypothetical protein
MAQLSVGCSSVGCDWAPGCGRLDGQAHQRKKRCGTGGVARTDVCVATIGVGSAAGKLVIEPVETPSTDASVICWQESCQLSITMKSRVISEF